MILAERPGAGPPRFSDLPPSLLQNVKRENFMDLKGKILYIFGQCITNAATVYWWRMSRRVKRQDWRP